MTIRNTITTKKTPHPYMFRVTVKYADGSGSPWHEEYNCYTENRNIPATDQYAKEYFKDMIERFNSNLRGALPRKLVSVQRMFKVKYKTKTVSKYLKI